MSDADARLHKPLAKDLKMMIKRGGDPDHIKAVMRVLIEGKPLDRKYGDHVRPGHDL
ncbi:MAG: hypothetical protein ABFD82_12775 [Syntrophaceae bacterium]